MKHELIIDKCVRKIRNDAYTFGFVVGSIGGIALGFMIGLGYGQ